MIKSFLSNKILLAYGTSLLGVLSGLLTSFWLLREITRAMPPSDFGLYAYVMQICAYLPLLQLSLDFAGTREIAHQLGRNAPGHAKRLFDALVRFNAGAIAIGAMVVFALAFVLWHGIALGKVVDSQGAARIAAKICLLAGSAQLVSFMARPYAAALMATERQAMVNLVSTGRTISTTVLAYFLLRLDLYVYAVPVAEIVTQGAFYFVIRGLSLHYCKWIKIDRPDRADDEGGELKSLMKFGALASLGGVAWTVESTSDVVILTYVGSPLLVSAYVLWWRFPQMLYDVCTRLTFSAFPSFSHRLGVSSHAASSLLGKVCDASVGLGSLAFVGIGVWLQPFVTNWIGADYAPLNSPLIPFLMGGLVCLRTVGNLLGVFWLALGRTAFGAGLAWSQTTVKIILAVLLAPKYGVSGLLMASCVSGLLQVSVVSINLIADGLLRIDVVARAGFLILLAAAISWAATVHPFDVGWAKFAIGTLVTAACWSAIWFAAAWTGDLKPLLRSIFARAKFST